MGAEQRKGNGRRQRHPGGDGVEGWEIYASPRGEERGRVAGERRSS